MTDTYTYCWLDSCLLDSDGRIFLDRDGDAFGDVLRYLCGGKDFLLELMNHLVIVMELLVVIMFLIHHHAAGSLMSRNHPMDMAGGSAGAGGLTNHHPSSTMLSNNTNAHHEKWIDCADYEQRQIIMDYTN